MIHINDGHGFPCLQYKLQQQLTRSNMFLFDDKFSGLIVYEQHLNF